MITAERWWVFLCMMYAREIDDSGWWHKPPAITFRRLKRWALKQAAKE